MDLFRNVKTGIGLLAAIVGAVVMIFQESINSELLKTANDIHSRIQVDLKPSTSKL